VKEEVNETVGVSPLVVVPRYKLDEVVGEGDSSTGIKDGRAAVVDKVLRDNLVLGVSENSLHLVLRGLLDDGLDLVVGGRLLQADGEVDDRHIDSGDTESHAGELALKLGKNDTNSNGGSGCRGDDVDTSSAAGSPVLSSLGGSINGELVGGEGVDGGHETLLNSKVVIDDLGEGSETVGGTRSVGDDGHVLLVLLVVDSHHEHGGSLGRGGDDNLLGTSLDVSVSGLELLEDTGTLSDPVNVVLSPRDVGGVSLGVDADAVLSDDEEVSVVGNLSLVATMNTVILELVGHVLGADEGIVHGDDGNLLAVEGGAEDETSDTSESVNSNSDGHF